MSPSPQIANEIERLLRDPDALRPEWERMQRERGYDPQQPRVPAGDAKGGQWTSKGGSGAIESLGTSRADVEKPLAQPAFLAPPLVATTIEALLALFAALSANNTPQQRATFDFNAREFLRDPHSELGRPNLMQLTQREVESVCRKLNDVQERTDRIAGAVRAGRPDLPASEFGTAVHTRIAHEINYPRRPDGGPRDPNYRAEVSYWKMAEDHVYARKDSIRVDVLEDAGRGLVCVYDIKTGQSRRSGLGFGRMNEIAKNVLGAYPHVERVIITEVRPRR
jgi:hypothetical protein